MTIAGMGVVSALGVGVNRTMDTLRCGQCALRPLALFGVAADQVRAVGAVAGIDTADPLPRTHHLARLAADEALAGCDGPPDAIVLGTTTGGIFTTETLLAADCKDPSAYRNHALTTVAEDLARRCGCTGPVITVSTACSSGAVAIKVAMEMLRSGLARKVLAGGADSLCRLTYFGFKSLQLIDPAGARPLDLERRGMSVAEGAAMLLLARDTTAADGLRVLGAGLSCDAHHTTAPHPDGAGALAAMGAAMADARLAPGAIDYINLHGTGTPDNDLAEGRAIRALFGEDRPPLSSIKGTSGHPLAAAGAIEAVVSALCIRHGLLPANVGYRTYDTELGLEPVAKPTPAPLATVMSNSFGFGGNNATLIVGTGHRATAGDSCMTAPPLVAEGFACITGAGCVTGTRERFFAGESCAGCLDEGPLAEGLPPRTIRRFKRLPRMALALAVNACEGVAADRMPGAVSLGTAWGALTETHDFLRRLVETEGQFPSPTDFVGSVHNAPAGQIAMHLGIKGANVTTSGGDASFEQALLVAGLLARRPGTSILVAGADECHPVLSPLFDPSVRANAMADGGGALLLRRSASGEGPAIHMLDYRSGGCPEGLAGLVSRLGGADAVNREYGVIMAGLPAGSRDQAEAQLAAFLSESRFGGPVVDYRRLTGEFGSASAVAAVMGVAMARQGVVPGPLAGGTPLLLQGKSMLLLGLGTAVTAVRISAP